MVRLMVYAALLIAIVIGLMLPNPNKPQKQAQASQIPTMEIN